MRKVSLWAKLHPNSARLSIVVIKLLLVFMAWSLGNRLLALNIHIPPILGALCIVFLVITAVTYPSKSGGNKKNRYYRQKTADFVLAALSFILITTLVNTNFNITTTSAASVNPAHRDANAITAMNGIYDNSKGITINSTYEDLKSKPTAQQILESLKYRDKSTLTRQEKRILRKEFKIQLKEYVKATLANDQEKKGNAGWVLLTIIGAVGLIYLLAGLSCTIACSGSDGLAVIVLIVGTALIVWGAVVLIRRIRRGPKEKVISDTPRA